MERKSTQAKKLPKNMSADHIVNFLQLQTERQKPGDGMKQKILFLADEVMALCPKTTHSL